MDREQDVEVELYEENVGNLNYSTPNESRSSSPDRFLPVLSSQEPTKRRLEKNPFVAIDPRPDPAPTSQVPRIHDSCHNGARTWVADEDFTRCHNFTGTRGPDEDFAYRRSTSIPKSTLDHQSTLDNRPPEDIQPRAEPSTWRSAITTQINALWR